MRLEGFEPPTLGSEDRCSNPLSYSREGFNTNWLRGAARNFPSFVVALPCDAHRNPRSGASRPNWWRKHDTRPASRSPRGPGDDAPHAPAHHVPSTPRRRLTFEVSNDTVMRTLVGWRDSNCAHSKLFALFAIPRRSDCGGFGVVRGDRSMPKCTRNGDRPRVGVSAAT